VFKVVQATLAKKSYS